MVRRAGRPGGTMKEALSGSLLKLRVKQAIKV